MIQNIQIAILKKIPRRQTPCLLWLLKMYHDATLSFKKGLGNQACPVLRTKMADAEEYFVCQCFFTHNIFLKEYEAHVVFESEQQFQNDYRKVCTNFANSKLISYSELSIDYLVMN